MITRWPRYCEVLLGFWLIASVWILDHGGGAGYSALAFGCGSLIVVLDVLSITERVRYGHLLILVVAGAQVCFAYVSLPAQSQGAQNLVTVALLLALFAILPTAATQPPKSWREFNRHS